MQPGSGTHVTSLISSTEDYSHLSFLASLLSSLRNLSALRPCRPPPAATPSFPSQYSMLSLPIPHMVCCYPVTIPLSVYDHFPAPQRKPLGPSRSGMIGPYGARRPLARMAPFFPQPLRGSTAGRYRCISRLKFLRGISKVRASNVDVGAGVHGDGGDAGSRKSLTSSSYGLASPKLTKPESGVRYLLSIAGVLLLCTAIFSVITITKGDPSVILAGFAKSGFTAAFTLIFVSEIGDKTFFIAALLAMQYDKAMVLCGSMGALSLMTILSVVIGRIFHSVPTQFHTTLPIGEYAAVALLAFFGLKSIKDAWKLSSNADANHEKSPEIGELVEAEELVKEKVSKSLKSPLEIIWKSFSLVFFAEWGDRSMLATIALGVAQSPWGVASGAITGHLFATSVAIIGGAFLATYISEKLVGFVSGVLFLVFSVATLFGAF